MGFLAFGSTAFCSRPESGLALVLNTRVLVTILVGNILDDQLSAILVNARTARICAVASTIATDAVPAGVFGRPVIIAVGVV